MDQHTVEHYKTVVAALEDGYYEVDTAGRFTVVNDAFCRILGRERAQILSTPYRQYTDGVTADQMYNAFNQVYIQGASLRSVEALLLRPDGEKRYVDISVTPIHESDGRIAGFCGITRDVTDWRNEATRREAQLSETRRLYAQIKELEEIKDFMLRVASQEIRSPLTLIAGYLDLLYVSLRERFTSDEQMYYDTIQHSIDRMMHMTNDFFILEKMHTVMLESRTPRQSLVYLDMLVRKAKMDRVEESRTKGLSFDVVVPETPVTVRGDENDISRAIDNLVNNAMRYTPKGGAVIVRLLVNKEEAVVSVEDTGYGVPEDKIVGVWTAFTRVIMPETQQIMGTGLGLYLVKRIVEWHGGRVFAHSVYKLGSTFGFALPIFYPVK